MNYQLCRKPYVQLLVGTVGMMLMGIAYAWSLFVAPLESALGWNRSQTSLVFTLSMIVYAVGMLLAGVLSKRINHKIQLLISAVLFGSGFLLSSMVTEPWQLNISYGVLVGLAAGIGYTTITCTVNKWFEGRIGMSSGVLFMGFGSGSFLFAGLINRLEKTSGWVGTFRILAVLMFVSLLLVTWLLFSPVTVQKARVEETKRNFTTLQMLHEKAFFAYYIWAILIWSVGLSIIGNAAVLVASLGGAGLAVMATGLISVTNGACRVILGRFYDRFGSRPTLLIVSTAMLAAMLLFQLAFKLTSIPIALAALFSGAVGCGGIAPTNSAFVRDCFGQKYYASNFGVMGTFGMFSSLAGSFVVGKLFAVSGTYRIAMLAPLLYAVIAMGVQWMVPAQKK